MAAGAEREQGGQLYLLRAGHGLRHTTGPRADVDHPLSAPLAPVRRPGRAATAPAAVRGRRSPGMASARCASNRAHARPGPHPRRRQRRRPAQADAAPAVAARPRPTTLGDRLAAHRPAALPRGGAAARPARTSSTDAARAAWTAGACWSCWLAPTATDAELRPGPARRPVGRRARASLVAVPTRPSGGAGDALASPSPRVPRRRDACCACSRPGVGLRRPTSSTSWSLDRPVVGVRAGPRRGPRAPGLRPVDLADVARRAARVPFAGPRWSTAVHVGRSTRLAQGRRALRAPSGPRVHACHDGRSAARVVAPGAARPTCPSRSAGRRRLDLSGSRYWRRIRSTSAPRRQVVGVGEREVDGAS